MFSPIIINLVVCRYHCLILPKVASIDAGDLSPEAAAGFFRELPKLISIVKQASGAPAVKVLGNCGGKLVFLFEPQHTYEVR